jgi:hypothetical protein
MKATIRNPMGETLITLELDAKTFSTGSRGYRGQGKVTMHGKKFQVQVQAVEVGSKPKAS